MNKVIKDLLDVEKPVLTNKLAPKLAPFAKVIYLVGLFLMAIFCIRLIGSLLSGHGPARKQPDTQAQRLPISVAERLLIQPLSLRLR